LGVGTLTGEVRNGLVVEVIASANLDGILTEAFGTTEIGIGDASV
jgi:hypothetical protein